MSFAFSSSAIILCTGENLLIYSKPTKTITRQNLPDLKTEKPLKHHNNIEIDAFHGITSVKVSENGDYFVVCTNRKQLCLYKTSNFELLSNRTLIRAASRVKFTPENDVIVADKSGDAYLYSTSRPEEAGELLLGHLSMLLDILVTNDNKYVISADRDEKIRVSHYPNSYNVKTFCLGHKNFVSNILELPHEKSVLISAGGDGEFKFWKYAEGAEIKSVNFMEHIRDDYLKKLNENLKDLELQEAVKNLPVKQMTSEAVGDGKSLLISSFYGSEVILVHEIAGGDDKIEMNHLQTINEDAEPIEIEIFEGKLWVLFDWGIKVYSFCGEGKRFEAGGDGEGGGELGGINGEWRKMREKAQKHMFYPILYKRKFDNVQEYQERKQSRMKMTK